jgi:hypothetical protein
VSIAICFVHEQILREKNWVNTLDMSVGQPQAYTVCPRTRCIYQSLDLPIHDTTEQRQQQQQKHLSNLNDVPSVTGVHIQRRSEQNVFGFGQYFWYNGPVIDTMSIFLFQDDRTIILTMMMMMIGDDDNNATVPWRPHSYEVQPLVQLDYSLTSSLLSSSSSSKTTTPTTVALLALLWTTQVLGTVIWAQLSGDGNATAVVVANDDHDDGTNDDETTFGVHTYDNDDNPRHVR